MSKISSVNLENSKDLEELKRFISQYVNDLNNIINGRLQFDENIQSQTVEVKFDNANEDVSVIHNLVKKDVEFWVTSKSASCDIYRGITGDTTKNIFLRSTVAGVTVTLKLI